MVSIDQIQTGLASYLDAELMPKLPQEGIQKVITGTALSLLLKRSGSIMQGYTTHPFIQMLGIVDENSNVDIATLKEELKKNISDSGFAIEIPMLGTMTFRREDVDKLYKHITGGV